MEAAYLREAFSDYARPLRLAVLIGVFLFAGFAAVDRYLFDRFVPELIAARGAVVAIGLVTVVLTFRPSFPRVIRPVMVVLHLAAGLTVAHLSNRHGSYVGGLCATLMFFGLLTRAQFVHTTVVNSALLLWFAATHEQAADVAATLVDVSMLAAAVLVIAMSAYAKERSERMAFVRRREVVEARDRALSANRAKSTFLANMSHELRTPLNAVIGYGELVQEDVAEAGLEHCVDDLDRILASSKHLLGLINDVLDLAKVEAGKVDVLEEEIAVAELTRDVAAAVEPLVKRNGNVFELETDGDVGTIVSDSTRLRQILFNLLSNAAKFTKDGRVSLTARRQSVGDQVAVEFVVADTGIGMTLAQQEHVFDSFRQADASTTREYGGTGLGLTITKHFVELLGGRVSLLSTLGQGSEFTVRIPVAPPDREARFELDGA